MPSSFRWYNLFLIINQSNYMIILITFKVIRNLNFQIKHLLSKKNSKCTKLYVNAPNGVARLFIASYNFLTQQNFHINCSIKHAIPKSTMLLSIYNHLFSYHHIPNCIPYRHQPTHIKIAFNSLPNYTQFSMRKN